MCALRFLDSADHYTTLAQKYSSVGTFWSVAAAAARTGIAGLRATKWGFGDQSLKRSLTAQGTWIVGFAFRSDLFNGSDIVSTMDGGSVQGRVKVNGDGTLTLYRGGVAVATSAKALNLNQYYYIEFKHIIANAGGLLEVRVNGETYATFNGDTQDTANPTANQIAFKGPTTNDVAANIDYDDIYILDGTGGAPNNNYWGDTQIEAKMPNGAGFYTEWATLVGAATHWQAVNEVPPNEDTSYIADNTVDSRDTFAFQDLSVISAQINGIQVLIRAREDVAGGVSIARMYRNAGADNQGADTVIQTGYAYYVTEIMETDPIAAGPWTVANINSAEFGVRVRP